MTKYPVFNENQLEQICKILGEATNGSIITKIFQSCSLQEAYDSNGTKWKRLYAALHNHQLYNHNGNITLVIIQKIMDPVRFIDNPDKFDSLRNLLNAILAFSGFQLTPEGKLIEVSKATTISEAIKRSNKLKADLYYRSIHPEVLRFCEPEFLGENYFHAVLEATKSVADKLRTKANLTLDGSSLVDKALFSDRPLLALNKLSTDSERSEQRGLGQLIKGIFMMFRNVTAHEPKIYKEYDYQEVLDCLTMLSFIHKQLDNCFLTGYRA